jgi:hypothetical protein
MNTDVKPNLALKSNSPCIDKGTYLTLANNAGKNSKKLIVSDSKFFQDGSIGSILSNVQADWIAIGKVNNVVKVASIEYSKNIIYLESPMTWSDESPIWLYKKSDGKRVLFGNAPDVGAYEYSLQEETIKEPSNLRILNSRDKNTNDIF